MRRFATSLLALGLAIAGSMPSAAQGLYTRLRSFGFGQFSAADPSGSLVEGTNGILYGVAEGGAEFGKGAVYAVQKDGANFFQLTSFSGTNGDGDFPSGRLCLASNGFIYGTTWRGGFSNLGTIYRVRANGSNYVVLKSFTGSALDGAQPLEMGLIQASNGSIYGTTPRGGASDKGIVFKIELDGTGFQILKNFTGTNGDGAAPRAGLMEGADGFLYGTTVIGGSNDFGTVFRLAPDGGSYAVLRSFTGTDGDGTQPCGALVQDANGKLYGTTYTGGTLDQGTVFSINPDGSAYDVLTAFDGPTGINPLSSLTIGTNGMLYGITEDYGHGSVFRLNADGNGFQVLKSFITSVNPVVPIGGLLQASDGLLYGAARFGWSGISGLIFQIKPGGTAYRVMRGFLPTGGDGINPQAALIEGTNGFLYGTTQSGGTSNQGVVFRVNKDGSDYALVKSFTGTNGDGAQPYAGVVQARDGMLYGATDCDYGSSGVLYGYGTVYRLDCQGSNYTVLHKFSGGAGGANPLAAPIMASDGLLYGTTFIAGTRSVGTVYKMNADGSGFAVVVNFGAIDADGTLPQAELIEGRNGKLYGTTQSGGVGGGVIFCLEVGGTGYQVLRRFSGNDGVSAQAPLIQGLDGALYGTTHGGGVGGGGTVFKLNPDGSGFTVLRSFTGKNDDGEAPYGLVQTANGMIYGTTEYGGANPPGTGTIFQLLPDGTQYAVLRSFIQNRYDGILPHCGLVVSSEGTLYGTTFGGGRDQNGTIFSLLPPAVLLTPVADEAGVRIRFLAQPNRTYSVEGSPSVMGPWTHLGSSIADTSGLAQWLDTGAGAHGQFYRASLP